MLNEITKINEIGDSKGILYFLKNIIGNNSISGKDIIAISSYLPYGLNIKASALIIFFEVLGIIKKKKINYFIPNSALQKLNIENISDLDEGVLIKYILEFTVKHHIISQQLFSYDYESDAFLFNSEKFGTDFAVFRNILIDLQFLVPHFSTRFKVNPLHEVNLETFFTGKNKSLTPDGLSKILKRKAEAGLIAEEFALEYEKKRIASYKLRNLIKHISLIDVTAGYDILSFNDDKSSQYNRFIEVKGYRDNPTFYWSKNEIQKAEKYLKNYFLYLVDLGKIGDSEYVPIIIQNPIRILESNDWDKEVESYRISSSQK